MGQFLEFSDLSPLAPNMTEAQANIYIADVEAQAIAEAPCIAEPGSPHGAAVKGILRQAVLRWARAGEGGVTQEQFTAGPFSQGTSFDTRQYGGGRLVAGEVNRLRALCRGGRGAGRQAFHIVPR